MAKLKVDKTTGTSQLFSEDLSAVAGDEASLANDQCVSVALEPAAQDHCASQGLRSSSFDFVTVVTNSGSIHIAEKTPDGSVTLLCRSKPLA